MRPETVQLRQAMRGLDYVAEPSIVTALYLAQAMEKPLLVEGDAGVGKTEIAKVMAGVLDTELIRLQCYEGLDANAALYEWNYQKQLLRLRIASDGRAASEGDAAPHDQVAPTDQATTTADELEDLIFSRRYLLERPLLRAITSKAKAPVLLVDEIDRADGGFEAFLLEVLSDFQVTIPELGTIRAERRPLVVLTSNRTRELETPFAGAACTCTSSIRRWRRKPRSSARRSPGSRSGWRTRSPVLPGSCERNDSRSRRASPKRWTGPPRW